MDEGTSKEEKDELQFEIIDIAHENGNISYGDSNGDGLIKSNDYNENGINILINYTYITSNENDIIHTFVNGGYINDDDTYDMNKIADDYSEYSNMLDSIVGLITNYG